MRKQINFKNIQIIALIAASLVYLGIKSLPPLSASAFAKDEYRLVSQVVDGDTLKLSGGDRVRLIGVDTPEVHYSAKLLSDAKKSSRNIKSIQESGRKASSFTKGLCGGKKIRLEFDVEKEDRYGRLLAYVYLEDGTFVNARIIEEGYAQVMTIPPNVKHAEYFLRLQKESREKRKGLWTANDNL
ncbi:MAG: thermonuclease family protein [Candidatus Omnitrophota bacterium]